MERSRWAASRGDLVEPPDGVADAGGDRLACPFGGRLAAGRRSPEPVVRRISARSCTRSYRAGRARQVGFPVRVVGLGVELLQPGAVGPQRREVDERAVAADTVTGAPTSWRAGTGLPGLRTRAARSVIPLAWATWLARGQRDRPQLAERPGRPGRRPAVTCPRRRRAGRGALSRPGPPRPLRPAGGPCPWTAATARSRREVSQRRGQDSGRVGERTGEGDHRPVDTAAVGQRRQVVSRVHRSVVQRDGGVGQVGDQHRPKVGTLAPPPAGGDDGHLRRPLRRRRPRRRRRPPPHGRGRGRRSTSERRPRRGRQILGVVAGRASATRWDIRTFPVSGSCTRSPRRRRRRSATPPARRRPRAAPALPAGSPPGSGPGVRRGPRAVRTNGRGRPGSPPTRTPAWRWPPGAGLRPGGRRRRAGRRPRRSRARGRSSAGARLPQRVVAGEEARDQRLVVGRHGPAPAPPAQRPGPDAVRGHRMLELAGEGGGELAWLAMSTVDRRQGCFQLADDLVRGVANLAPRRCTASATSADHRARGDRRRLGQEPAPDLGVAGARGPRPPR